MRRARALVGHFNSSSQASQSLAAIQQRCSSVKSKKVINDCSTRWWSTWKFVQRLRELKLYFGLIVQENVIEDDLNLSGSEWDMLEDIEGLLEPFMMIQRILEGQKYVTISFVPYLITVLRRELESKSVNARSHAVRGLAHNMLTHKVKGLNTYWGTGDENTLFDENEDCRQRQPTKRFPAEHVTCCCPGSPFKIS